jgi:hypothetical protein
MMMMPFRMKTMKTPERGIWQSKKGLIHSARKVTRVGMTDDR